MNDEVAVLDSDVLSDLSRDVPAVRARAARYLARHGRLTTTVVTVFERLRGYHAAIRAGRPYQEHLRRFEELAASCTVLPLDHPAAARAARIWAAVPPRRRRAIEDLLIAAIAGANGLPLATRNRRDFEPLATLPGLDLRLLSWS